MSRALSRTWWAGEEIIITRLDHDASVTPCLLATEDHGIIVRWLDFDPPYCTLMLHQLSDLLNEKTKLLAIFYGHFLRLQRRGSITNVRCAVQLAHANNTLIYVNTVHFTPHGLLDMQTLDCDLLACNAYKYFVTIKHSGNNFGL